MSDQADQPTINVTKVRAGLAMIGVVIAAALALVVAIDSPVGKAVMFAVAFSAMVRAFLLYRSLKQERAAGVA